MYTENADVEKEYYDEEEDYSSNNRRSLIIKIIIIVICAIILIWLILALKKSRNDKVVYDPNAHANNVQEIRLAAEKYFFIDGNMPNKEAKTITLETLKNKGLIKKDIIDANKKVCNDTNSTTSLSNDNSAYIMKIRLSCSTNENEETFYYDKKTLACLNCNGKTLMDGSQINNGNTSPIEEDNYNCNTWSKWTSKKENDLSLIERVRKLYLGVKEGKEVEKTIYSEWSEYTKNPILASDDIEIEVKNDVENVWSDTKSTTNYITNSDTIKVISTTSTGGGSYTYCPKGYKKDNSKCVSETAQRGDLTYLEYFSGNYIIQNKPCDRINTEPDGNGRHQLVYKNCLYNTITDVKTGYSNGTTVYYYQELISTPVVYYRYRTKTIEKEKEDDIYTTDYYEENNMPSGYKKVANSEKLEYSYKLSECEK